MPAVASGSTVTLPKHLQLGQFTAFETDESGAANSVGEPVAIANISSASAEGRWQLIWALKRRFVLSPKQFVQAMVFVSLVFLLVAAFVWHIKAALVLPFALLEMLFVAVAAFLYTRHIADQDFIGLRDDMLRVESHRGGQVLRWDFNPRWVRIEPRDENGSLVRLSAHGKFVDVGRYLREDLRLQLAAELRWAIRQLTH